MTSKLPVAVAGRFSLVALVLAGLVLFLGRDLAQAQAPGVPDPFQMQRMHLGFYLWWEESGGASGYDIQIRSQSGTSWGPWQDVSYSGTTQPAIVTGLTHDTKYQWRIRATAGGQQSAWSTLLGDSRDTRTASRFGNSKPNPPILRSAVPGPGRVTLTWQPGPARSGVTIHGFRVSWRWEDGQGVQRKETTGLLGADVTSYAVSGLSAGVQYDFWVRPLVGDSGGAGSIVLQAVPLPGGGPVVNPGRCNHHGSTPPGPPVITSVTPQGDSITLRWDSPSYGRTAAGTKDLITNFIVSVRATDNSHESTSSVTAKSYEPASYVYPISGLSPAQSFQLRLQARTLTGCYSGWSSIEVAMSSALPQQERPPGAIQRPADETSAPDRIAEPEPAERGITEIVARYDANNNGAIDVSEYIQARRDYAYGKISEAEWQLVLDAWLASQYR